MLKNFFFILFCVFFAFKADASSKISFIDINYIIEKSNAGTQIKEILSKKRDKETKKLEAKKISIKKKEDEFKSKSNILNDEEKNKKINIIKKEIEDYKVIKNYSQKNSFLDKLLSTVYANKTNLNICRRIKTNMVSLLSYSSVGC